MSSANSPAIASHSCAESLANIVRTTRAFAAPASASGDPTEHLHGLVTVLVGVGPAAERRENDLARAGVEVGLHVRGEPVLVAPRDHGVDQGVGPPLGRAGGRVG